MSEPAVGAPGGRAVEWPTVSVIMPIRNEATDLAQAVDSVLAQDYPRPFDVCLAVGPSTDGTADVAAGIAARQPRVTIVDNPSGRTPAALNAAIGATAGEVVVRVDGHAELSPGYIRLAVGALLATGAANVGGVQQAAGVTRFERAVAAAMRSRFGTGGARFHVGGAAGQVDTVYLGVFRRSWLERVGGYDERLVRNQDYELNIRLRQAGGVVWFDPRLSVGYRPRSTWATLARQYWQYGQYKRAVVRLHPRATKARQLVPAAATAAVAGGLLAAPRWPWALLAPGAYAAAVTAAGVATDRTDPLTAAGVLATMHLAWGAGFLTSRPRRLLRGQAPRPSGASRSRAATEP